MLGFFLVNPFCFLSYPPPPHTHNKYTAVYMCPFLSLRSDIAALVLYNLSLKYDKRCFKNDDVELFIKDNWDVLQCGNVSLTMDSNTQRNILSEQCTGLNDILLPALFIVVNNIQEHC